MLILVTICDISIIVTPLPFIIVLLVNYRGGEQRFNKETSGTED